MARMKKHHSDPMVGGDSESEGKYWGKGEYANMPQKTRMDMYPKASEFGPGNLDDTMGEIDRVNKVAKEKPHRFLSNQH